jgi:hypothetical protein
MPIDVKYCRKEIGQGTDVIGFINNKYKNKVYSFWTFTKNGLLVKITQYNIKSWGFLLL